MRTPQLHGDNSRRIPHVHEKTISLDVAHTDTIAQVKAMIQAKEGIPTHLQDVRLPGINFGPGQPGMQDGGTLSEYHVKHGHTLVMASVSEIFVRTLAGETITVAVSPLYETINHVKAIIRDKEDIPFHQQRLIFKDQVVSDYHGLSEYGIWGGAELTLARVDDEELRRDLKRRRPGQRELET